MTVVLGGDFRQILPVIPRGTRADIVRASILSSPLWQHCTLYSLTENMRLQNSTLPEVSLFNDWVMKVGDGSVPSCRLSEDEEEPSWIAIPNDFLIPASADLIADIISSTYPELTARFGDTSYLKERAILSSTNEIVDVVNDRVISMLPGDIQTFLSADKVSQASDNFEAHTLLYPTEYLNTFKFSGFPNHELRLKVGVPVMLMRNLNQSLGLCNGTRMVVTRLAQTVIEAEIITGLNSGRRFFIPRVEMVPSDTDLPFMFCRRQFPLKVCFAMTINKSQGQTFNHVGLYLPQPVFSHGQLYVAASRVTSPSGFRVLLQTEDPTKPLTRNIVYREVFQRLYQSSP